MIQAVLFDMDGTLFNTEQLYYDQLVTLMQEYGYTMTHPFFMKTLGVPIGVCQEMYIQTYGDDFPYETIYTRLFDDVRTHVKQNGTPLKPGVTECFTALKARRLPMVLATSCPRFAVDDFFSTLPELDAMLSGKVCGDEVTHGKPAPEIFQKAAKLAGVDPADCLGVEDSPSGLRAIRESGAYAVMIPDLKPYTDALAPYTDTVLQSLRELPGLIDQLNAK